MARALGPALACLWSIACARPDDAPIGPLALIPLPSSVSGDTGFLHLDERSRIVADPGVTREAELLAAILRRSTGFPFQVVSEEPGRGDLVLALDPSLTALGDEGYRLEVDDLGLTVVAPSAAGVFWGCQTLRQLLPPEVESPVVVEGVDWAVPQVDVEDQPRFGWRGVMLDVARHFFTVDEVKGLIDVAAHYKLDRFHLHLTDDQGWRLDLASWPELARVGGATEVGGGPGGFYTREDYAELVAFAAERHVVLVPEIDLPGHCNAALASYGELVPTGIPAEPYTGTDVGFSSLWLDGPDTMRFVEDVLGEVAAMTPGPYLHVGGDEAHATSPEDYGRFIGEVQDLVDGLGKTMIGWEEIGTAPIGPPTLAQRWRDPAKVSAAADQGARIVSSPADKAYLDMIYDLDSPVGGFWAGATTVEDAYTWDPVPPELLESQVAGLEAPLWTETVATLDDLEFLMFPRLLGHAEIGWSASDGRAWDEYRERLARHGSRLERWGIGHHATAEVEWTDD